MVEVSIINLNGGIFNMKKLISETAFPVLFRNNSLALYYSGNLKADKTIEETAYHQTFIVNCGSEGFNIPPADDRPERMLKVVFGAISSFLNKKKISKENEATAVVLQDLSGNFIFMAASQYHPNFENPDEPGNWTLTMSFYEKDLEALKSTKDVKVYYFNDTVFKVCLDRASHDLGGIQIENEVLMFDSCLITVNTLLQITDYEAVEGEVVDIEMPGYFVMSVSIEDGEKVVSMTPCIYEEPSQGRY